MKKYCMIIVLCLVGCLPSAAQKISLSTDILGYACLGTINAEASLFVSRRWSLTAGIRYNPFTFNKADPDRQLQLRQQSYAVGARYWPWHTGSGWWLASKLRYQEYNFGGIFSPETSEGDRFGAGIYIGYTHMLTPHLNIEFGAGVWGGTDAYRKYSCPVCGFIMASGRKLFILPDDLMVSLAYVF